MSEIVGKTQPGFLNMPKLPVSGLLIRFFAFFIDMFVLWISVGLLSANFPEIFWALDLWSSYVVGAGFFLYFVLLNGPPGKGRTLGKLLTGLVVTDYEGDPISWRQAILRTVILMPVLITVPLTNAFMGTVDSDMEGYFRAIITVFLLLAVFISTAISLPFNPFKQGLHDFLAQTLVRPARKAAGTEYETFADLQERVGFQWVKFHRQPQYSGGVTIALILILLAFISYPSRLGPDVKARQKLRRDAQQLPGLEAAGLTLYSAQAWETITGKTAAESVKDVPPICPPTPDSSDIPTTGSMVLVAAVDHLGKWPRSEGEVSFQMEQSRISGFLLKNYSSLAVYQTPDEKRIEFLPPTIYYIYTENIPLPTLTRTIGYCLSTDERE